MFRIWGCRGFSDLRIEGLGLMCLGVQDIGIQGFGFAGFRDLGFKALSKRVFRVEGSGVTVKGFGFRIHGDAAFWDFGSWS